MQVCSCRQTALVVVPEENVFITFIIFTLQFSHTVTLDFFTKEIIIFTFTWMYLEKKNTKLHLNNCELHQGVLSKKIEMVKDMSNIVTFMTSRRCSRSKTNSNYGNSDKKRKFFNRNLVTSESYRIFILHDKISAIKCYSVVKVIDWMEKSWKLLRCWM